MFYQLFRATSRLVAEHTKARSTASKSTVTFYRLGFDVLEGRVLLDTVTVTWTGKQLTSDWSDGGNWSSGKIPNRDQAVIIPALPGKNPFYPVLDDHILAGRREAKSLTIQRNASLKIITPLQVFGPVTNDGTLTLEKSSFLGAGGPVTDHGTLIFKDNAKLDTNSMVIDVGPPGGGTAALIKVEGAFADIHGNVTNSGIIWFDPTIKASMLLLVGGFTQTANGEIEIPVDSNKARGVMSIIGTAQLDGTLDLTPVAGTNPPATRTYTPISYGSGTEGKFKTPNWDIGKFRFLPDYQQNELVIYVPAKGGMLNPVNPQVGVAFNGPLATFTDPGEVNPSPSDYTAAILWGDGSTSAGTVSSDGNGGFIVTGNHTYTAAGPAPDPLSVTITGDGSSLTLSEPVTVAQGNGTTTTLTSSNATATAGQAVTFTAAVNSLAGGAPTGTVTFLDGDTALETVTLNQGTATLSTSALDAGTHFITASYSGDDGDSASTSTALAQVVNQPGTTLTVSSSSNLSSAGQAVTFTVAASAQDGGTPTGTITVSDGTTPLGSATLTGGSASFTTAALGVGNHSIIVSYGGDIDNGPAAAVLAQTVSPSATTTTLAADANPAAAGQAVTLTATVNSATAGTATGLVVFFDGSTILGTAPVNAGTASLTTSLLGEGTHSLTAGYSGDGNTNASISPALALDVTPSATTTTLLALPAPAATGPTITFGSGGDPIPVGGLFQQSGTFTDPTGDTWTATVDYGDGSGPQPLAVNPDGTFTLSHTYTADGDFIVLVTFQGASGQVASGNSVAAVGDPSPASDDTPWLDLGGDAAVAVGSPFQQTGSFYDPAGGTWTATVDYGDGSGSQPLTVNPDGTFLLSDTYTSSGDYDVVVTFQNATGTVVSDDISVLVGSGTLPNSPALSVGEPVLLMALVNAQTDGIPTGIVTFEDGSQVLGTATVDDTGTATLSLPSLPLGQQLLTAVYSGDSNFAGSTSAALDQAVTSTDTTTLTASANPAVAGTPVTLTATVASTTSGVPTGDVQFWLTDATGADLSLLGTGAVDGNGQATLSLSTLPAGSDGIEAQYLGDGTFDPSSATLTEVITVVPAVSSVLPSTGPSTGGSSVLVLGQGFTDATAVSFGGTAAVSFSVVSDTEIVAVAPAASVGSVDVTVTNSAGTSVTSPADQFTFSSLSSTTTTLSSSASTTYGQALTLTATVSADSGTPTGTVTFLDGNGNVLGSSFLSPSGIATLTVTDLPAGDDLITASYGGDSNFAGSAATPIDQTVSTADPTLTLSSSANPAFAATPVTLTVAVASTTTGTPTGTVLFWQVDAAGDDLSLLGTAVVAGTGTATLSVATLPVGSDTVQADYLGDGNFNPNAANLTQVITLGSTTTRLSSSANPASSGQAVTFTAAVSSQPGLIPTGTVTFYDGPSVLGTAPVLAGLATFTTAALPVGTDSITAVYSGDASNSGSSSSPLQEVINTLGSTTTTLTASANPATVGQAVTLSAEITTQPGLIPTGTVTFYNGTTVLGTASVMADDAFLTTTALPVGSDSLTAVYSGDASNNGSSSAVLTEVVNPAQTMVMLSSSSNPAQAGQPVTFTADVMGTGGVTPTGTITFYDGTTVLGTVSLNGMGMAALTVSDLAVGSHSITAVYSGDATYSGSSSSPLQEVIDTLGSTTTTLTASANPATAGQAVTLSAMITPQPGLIPTGTAVLGTASVMADDAFLTTTALPVGSESLTAVYSGDPSNNGSSSAVLTEVVNLSQTMVMLSSSSNPAQAGQPVTFSADVSALAGVTPTGTITFYDGTTVLGVVSLNSMGMAALTVSDLAVGSHSITAVYSGDATYSGSSSSALQEVIDDQMSMTGLTSSQNPAPAGSPVTFTATVSSMMGGTPTGPVQFWVLDPTTLLPVTLLGTGTLNSSGQASVTVSSLTGGSYLIEALYLGDGTFNSSSATLTQDIS
jgi:hypothetical protein